MAVRVRRDMSGAVIQAATCDCALANRKAKHCRGVCARWRNAGHYSRGTAVLPSQSFEFEGLSADLL